MKTRAPLVAEWVERMNKATTTGGPVHAVNEQGEVVSTGVDPWGYREGEWFSGESAEGLGSIPPTLVPMLDFACSRMAPIFTKSVGDFRFYISEEGDASEAERAGAAELRRDRPGRRWSTTAPTRAGELEIAPGVSMPSGLGGAFAVWKMQGVADFVLGGGSFERTAAETAALAQIVRGLEGGDELLDACEAVAALPRRLKRWSPADGPSGAELAEEPDPKRRAANRQGSSVMLQPA